MKYLGVLTVFALLLLCGCNQKKSESKSSPMVTQEEVSTEELNEIKEVVTKLDDAKEELEASGDELESLLNDLD